MRCLKIINSWPIRIKLLVLIVVVFLPGAGIITVNGLREGREQLEKATRDALLLVEGLSAQQEQVAAGTKQILGTLAQLPEVQNLDIEACNDLFRKITTRQTYYSNMALDTPDGNMVAASTPFKPGSINLSDRKHIQETIRDLDFSAGEYTVGRTSNLRSIHYAYPVLDANNRLIAILTAGFKLDEYAGFIEKAGLPEGSAVAITEHKGRRLYRLPENDAVALGNPIPAASIARLLGGADQGTYEITAEDGVNRIYAFKQLRLRENLPPYLWIFVGIPKDAVLHKANLVIFNSLLMLGLAAAVSLSMAWFLGSFVFISPINRLVATAQRFGRGEMGARTGLPHTPDELGKLADAIDEMASMLEKRNVESRNAEVALRESEERYRNISSSISDFAFSCMRPAGGDYAINWLAGAVESITGYSIKEVMDNRCWRFFVHSEDMAIFDKNVTGLEPGSSGQCELRIIHKDGSIRWIRAASRAAESSSLLGPHNLVGSCEDITERKRAEDELREKERKYRALFEAANDGIFLQGSTGFVDCNQKGADMYGLKREKVIGRSPEELSPERQPDGRLSSEVAAEKIRAAFEGVPQFFEWQALRADGVPLDVDITLNHVEVGGSVLLQAVVRDISERNQAEKERRRLEERLQRAEKMEALGTLAGGVAHDLNNVLGVVVGYSELLLYAPDGSSSIKSKATEILNAGQKAAAIVQDLLTLARRGIQHRDVLNLNKVLLGSQRSPEFAKIVSCLPDIMVKSDLEMDLLNISGSSVHLEKSFINLVSNAVEAMPGGGALTIKTANRYLDKPVSGYDTVREGDYVVLSVSDTGEGISAADLKRVFEPFYTKKIMGRSGTGLGLAVVWGTVKDHYGYINVESEEGKGTTVTLYFPVTREDITPEQVSLSAAEFMGKGESILVVDDVEQQRELAMEMLTKQNYRVTTVSSGEEALEYLKLHQVDLVVLDMIMDPGMDGLDTYSKILEIHPGQKAIIVSGFSETERVGKAQALGAGAYVKKPYVREKLGLAVRSELDRPAGFVPSKSIN